MYGRRIAAPLGEAVRSARRIALVGPPHAGKATLARTYVHRRHGSVVDLTDPSVRQATAAAVDDTLAGLTPPVAVLEHHLVDGLDQRLAAVQDATDAHGDPWLLTSSRRSTTTPGATRIPVSTLTLDERDHAPAPRFVRRLLEGGIDTLAGWVPSQELSTAALVQRAAVGGFIDLPEPAHDDAGARTTPGATGTTHRAALESLLHDALLAPVRAASRLRHPQVLRELLVHHARGAGAEPGPDAALARALGVSPPTVQRYRQLLHEHHLLLDLPPTLEPAGDAGATPARADALVCDAGLAALVLDVPAAELTATSPTMARGLLLTLLAHDLRVQTDYDAPTTRLTLHRAASGRRVLALVDADGGVIGVDVVTSAPPEATAGEGLRELAATAGERWRGGVLLAPVAHVTAQDGVALTPLQAPWELR